MINFNKIYILGIGGTGMSSIPCYDHCVLIEIAHDLSIYEWLCKMYAAQSPVVQPVLWVDAVGISPHLIFRFN